MSYLDNINSPADVKKLSLKELEALAEEIRSAVLNRDSKIGGHVGPNLGIVETTIALHYVFNSPEDKIVYDVSHQSYPHKILTGRKNGFLTDEGMREISGYTNPAESEHDHFIVGHTSTSVSLACGLAKARDLKGEKHNVIAVIGDGSLSGGEALEGFDNAAVLNSNIIIIVNDNEMSIAENHGGLYGNLRLLRQTGGKAECNMFKALGFDYRYLEEGNDIAKLTSLMKEVKDTDKPTVLHIHTEKGKGYKPAEEHKETWHWSVPFDIASGNPTVDLSGENYNSITVNTLIETSDAGYLSTRADLIAGKSFVWGDNRFLDAYGRFALIHDIDGKSKVRVADYGFAEDLSSLRYELGTGVSTAWSEDGTAYLEASAQLGSRIKLPWEINFGIQYRF